MTTIPPGAKLRVYIVACTAWVCAAVWLVGCVAAAAPMRVGCAAVLAVVLLGIAVGFIKHDLEMDLLRARSGPSVDPSEDLFSK